MELKDAFPAVRINNGFWGGWIERNRTATLPHALAKCEESGYIRHMEMAAGRRGGQHAGEAHEDSDLFKVMEGLCYALSQTPDDNLEQKLNELIDLIADAQESDGYLNSYFTTHKEEGRYQDIHRSHELYAFGHLIEAAVAYFESTGKRRLLDVALKLVDHLDATFGPGKLETVPGHQELELALVRLYRATSDRRCLDLARYFVDMRGDPERVQREYAGKPIIENDRTPGRNRPPEYRQDHCPATEQRTPVGHAVRAGYFYAAMADIALTDASEAHTVAVNAIWEAIVSKHLYLSGGIGTHQHRDEGFGDDYLLPNDTGYCETCGGIALLLFTHRLNLLKRDAKYADLIELILYNHLLACPDLEGVNFNYRNPLSSDGTRRRHPWPNPACCPTNLVRIIPQIGRFAYGTHGDSIYIDQFVSSVADVSLDVGHVRIKQETQYPWDGRIQLTVEPQAPADFALHIRIPGWTRSQPVPSDLYTAEKVPGPAPSVKVNGEAITFTTGNHPTIQPFYPGEATNEAGPPIQPSGLENGYCVIKRTWQPGDQIMIDFPMPVQRMHAHEKVEADRGRVALMRGPLLYCLEETDLNRDPEDVILSPETHLIAEKCPDLLDGVTVLTDETGSIKSIPFYACNNREPGRMLVWIKGK